MTTPRKPLSAPPFPCRTTSLSSLAGILSVSRTALSWSRRRRGMRRWGPARAVSVAGQSLPGRKSRALPPPSARISVFLSTRTRLRPRTRRSPVRLIRGLLPSRMTTRPRPRSEARATLPAAQRLVRHAGTLGFYPERSIQSSQRSKATREICCCCCFTCVLHKSRYAKYQFIQLQKLQAQIL